MEEWDVTDSPDGVTAVRVFIDDATAAGIWSLPAGGQRFTDHREALERIPDDIDVSQLQVKDRKVKIFGRQGCNKYVVNYAVLNNLSELNSNVNVGADDLPRSFELASEMVEITNTQGDIKWADDSTVIDETVKLYRMTGIMPWTVKKRIRDLDKFLEKVWACVGGVNAETVSFLKGSKGWDSGTVLFQGVSGGEGRDRRGRRVWLLDLHFSCKRVTFEAGVKKDGWNFAPKKVTGTGDAATYKWVAVVPPMFPYVTGIPDVLNFRDFK